MMKALGYTYRSLVFSILIVAGFVTIGCGSSTPEAVEEAPAVQVVLDTAAILSAADQYLTQEPKTVTAFPISRSAGGLNDYYSEGRYWWPNPEDPDGPYIRKDGQSNPELFTKHREAVSNYANVVSALTVAYLKTGDQKYAEQAKKQVLAWYVNPKTRMNPSLNYSQAIKGVNEGRGIGIIDTRSFIYVAKSLELLKAKGVFSKEEWTGIQTWFSEFGDWLTTSQFGHDERDNNNNHSTWWGAQLAAFARVAGRKDLLDTAAVQYRRQLAIQMDERGVFPDEVGRTRPFHYTEYNLDAFAVLADLLSEKGEDLWSFQTPNGDFKKSADWYLSFIGELEQWPYPSELEPNLAYHPAEYLLLLSERYADKNSAPLDEGRGAYAETFASAAAHNKPNYPERLAILTWPSN
jgi:hypothetical protein